MFHPQIIIYKRNFDENKLICFLIKEALIILIDLIDRKDENYYPKVFLEKYYFIEHMKIFCINFDEECYDEECINFFKKTLRK